MTKAAEKIQNTLSIKLDGETIVSRPFDFEAACLVDDMRYSSTGMIGPMHLGKKAVNHMFKGTKLTDELIETLPYTERKRLCEEAAGMYFESMRSNEDSDSKNE